MMQIAKFKCRANPTVNGLAVSVKAFKTAAKAYDNRATADKWLRT